MKKLFLLLMLGGCMPMPPVNDLCFIPYVVFKGMTNANEAPRPLATYDIKWSFKTNGTWSWGWRNNDDNDWSKIAGIYYQSVHFCSVRITYRCPKIGDSCFPGYKEIGYRIYDVNKTPESDYGKKHKLSGTLWSGYTLEKVYDCRTGWIKGDPSKGDTSNFWVIGLNDIEIKIPTDFKPVEPAGFDFPFCGGDNPAYQTWIIPIRMNEW